MTTKTMLKTFGPGALVLAYSLAPAHAEAATTSACATTAASLHGWYGMLVAGAAISANGSQSKYEVGAVLFDGLGKFTGNNVYSGTATPSAVTGSYSVNSDCTVAISMLVGAGPAASYVVALKNSGEAAGIEVDASGVSTIDFQPQYATYTPGLNFTAASLNGSFAGNCIGGLSLSSDVNLVTFANGSLAGTDPFNNIGTFAAANVAYTGAYTVNSDGTFAGYAGVGGSYFDFFGVISNSGTELEYIYTNSSGQGVLPTGGAFESCLLGASANSTVVTPPPPSFTLTPVTNPITLRQNQGTTDNVTVTKASGFSGAVTLSLSGAPAGVGTAVVGNELVFFVPAATPVGSYTITLTGTSGTTTATTPLTLNVTGQAAFTLSPANPTLTVAHGSAGSDAISLTPVNGFTGSISYGVTGLPSGATATFSPATSSGGTTLNIATSAATKAGASVLTVTGTAAATGSSQSFTETTTITLNVF